MTLAEMAREYRLQEDRYRRRILLLKKEKRTLSGQQRLSMEKRINDLTALRRETREIATLLENYYERSFYKNGHYAL